MDPVTDIALTGLAKGVASVGITKIMSDYVKPKWEVLKHDRLLKSKLSQAKPDVFAEYFQRTYEDNCYIRTIALRNQRQLLKELYIPLVLTNEAKNRDLVQIRINERSMESLLGKKVLIVDTAGMGKSTIMKFLCLDALENGFGIPVLINLRNLTPEKNIINTILQNIKGLDERFFDIEILEALIKAGDFIFFFDGYDEIDENRREAVSMELTNFISKAAATNTILMSSRDINGLEEFSKFERYQIQRLTKDEAYKIIRKYGADDIEIAENLIKDLKGTSSLDHFLTDPLSVSLLFRAYAYKGFLPLNKSDFYRQIFDALYEDHDRGKGGGYRRVKKCGLGKEDFHRVLRKIGFKGFFQLERYSYFKEELVKLIEESKIELGMDFETSSFIDDLIEGTPLIYREGNKYQWSHKSLQEYFAACYIYYDMRSNQREFLNRMATTSKAKKYFNILTFYYELDREGIEDAIIMPVLESLVSCYEKVREIFGDTIDCEALAQEIYKSNSKECDIVCSDELPFFDVMFDEPNLLKDKYDYKHSFGYAGDNKCYYAELGYESCNLGVDIIAALTRNNNPSLFIRNNQFRGFIDEFNKFGESEMRVSLLDLIEKKQVNELNIFSKLIRDQFAVMDIKKVMGFISNHRTKVEARQNELDYLL